MIETKSEWSSACCLWSMYFNYPSSATSPDGLPGNVLFLPDLSLVHHQPLFSQNQVWHQLPGWLAGNSRQTINSYKATFSPHFRLAKHPCLSRIQVEIFLQKTVKMRHFDFHLLIVNIWLVLTWISHPWDCTSSSMTWVYDFGSESVLHSSQQMRVLKFRDTCVFVWRILRGYFSSNVS